MKLNKDGTCKSNEYPDYGALSSVPPPLLTTNKIIKLNSNIFFWRVVYLITDLGINFNHRSILPRAHCFPQIQSSLHINHGEVDVLQSNVEMAEEISSWGTRQKDQTSSPWPLIPGRGHIFLHHFTDIQFHLLTTMASSSDQFNSIALQSASKCPIVADSAATQNLGLPKSASFSSSPSLHQALQYGNKSQLLQINNLQDIAAPHLEIQQDPNRPPRSRRLQVPFQHQRHLLGSQNRAG